MKLYIPVTVDAPDGATHYAGEPPGDMTFYKVKDFGVAGEHWFIWKDIEKEWAFISHRKPHWISTIPAWWRK